ncbi:MAG: redoxin domain-containing protein, partial [Myxococcales bacterium]|nr:redoxin domain-containing protein [Myxococcales bacterium]
MNEVNKLLWAPALLVGLALATCKPAAPADAPTTEAPAPVEPAPVDPIAAAPQEPSEQAPSDAATAEPESGEPVAQVDPQPEGEGAPEAAETPAAKAKAEPEPLPPPLFKDVKGACGGDPGVGTSAKPFALKSPSGGEIKLASYRGRVVLLNFWGTWCKPCLKELPEFDRLYRRYRKHGLTLIAVATDEDADAVAAFVKQRKLAAKVAIGGQALADAYGSPQFPFSFVIDKG